MELGERLRLARGDEPRKSAAAAVGIAVSTLQMYENGRRVPRDPVKLRLARHYGVSVEALFFATDATKCDATPEAEGAAQTRKCGKKEAAGCAQPRR